MNSGVYVLHYVEPVQVKYKATLYYGGPLHYVGIGKDVYNRIYKHITGTGASFTKLAFEQGIECYVSVIWLPATTANERFVRLNLDKYCRYCAGEIRTGESSGPH